MLGSMALCVSAQPVSKAVSPDPSKATTSYSVSTTRIWEGPYCAFTSLVEFKGRYYCAFREASSHLFDADGHAAEGVSRIIVSDDGTHWRSAAMLAKSGLDLRDPKLSVMLNFYYVTRLNGIFF